MKKIITCGIAASICALALSTQAFAETLTNTSIYAADREELAKLGITVEWKGENVFVDPNTITALYYADILDYARTGKLDLKKHLSNPLDEGQNYIANAINEKGDYVGIIEFTVGGEHPGFGGYRPKADKSVSANFEPNARRLNSVMTKRGIDTDCKEIKLVAISGVGYVYYIDNGMSQYLAASNLSSANGNLFNNGNGGIVEIGDELKAFADQELAEYEEYKREVLDKLAPGENIPTGGNDTPQFTVDNTPYLDGAANPPESDNSGNPNTGGTGLAVAGAGALAACAVGITLLKKKKD